MRASRSVSACKKSSSSPSRAAERQEILNDLAEGKLNATEAAAKIRSLKKGDA
jgi:hypothetical protein